MLALGTERAPTATETETEGRLSTVHPTFPKASCIMIMTLDIHMQALLAVIFTSTCAQKGTRFIRLHPSAQDAWRA